MLLTFLLIDGSLDVTLSKLMYILDTSCQLANNVIWISSSQEGLEKEK